MMTDPPSAGNTTPQSLASYRAEILASKAAQANAALLDDIRDFNHTMIDELARCCPVKGRKILDLGASPHGYALEHALELGVALYVGIGLDVANPHHVVADDGGRGLLLRMDANSLQFPAETFDAIISISTLEHVADVSGVLAEAARVLKHGGRALFSFEPIWSSSRGHHLHHFGECSQLLPPWAHLLWTPDEMRAHLISRWPADAALSLDEAIEWTYQGDAINRVTLPQFRAHLADAPLVIEWLVELRDDAVDPSLLRRAATATGMAAEDLAVRGLSVLLRK